MLYGFSRLQKSGDSPPQLWLIGDGSAKNRLIEISRDLGILEQVKFFGAQETVAPFLPQLDVFILPSKWEGMSMALLEAMSHGIPVIATNVGGTPEVITNRYTGLLIPPNDPQAITEAIELLRNDPGIRKELGSLGRKHVNANFSLEKTARSIDELYRRLLSL